MTDPRPRRAGWLAIALASMVVAVAGCAATDPSTSASDEANGTAAAPAIAAPDTVWCAGTAIPRSLIDEPAPASGLPPELAPLGSWWLPGFDPGTPWRLVEKTDTDAMAIRAIDDTEAMEGYGWADVPHWQYFTASTVILGPDIPGTDWSLINGGTCQLRTMEATGSGPVWLDPDHPIEPDDTSITVLVDVQASCYAGTPLDEIAEQVHLIRLSEGPDAIRLIIGVHPSDPTGTGIQGCPGVGFPPVPFTIDLADPVGVRTLLDASTYPDAAITDLPW